MGRGKSRSSRDLPKPINPKGRKMIGFGLSLMGFARAHPILRAAPYNPLNQLKPRSAQKLPGKVLVTSILVIHFGFLNPSLVAVRKRSGKPNGSVMGSRAYLVARIVCGCSAAAMA